MNNKVFSQEDALRIGKKLGLSWKKYNIEQFLLGLGVELEHGTINAFTNVTNDDEVVTAKITLAHLKEIPDYYTRLKVMESKAEKELKTKKD